MDLDYLTGVAAFVSALLIFCGSVWLLLAMVLGARLAYFVSATVTLAFILIMGVVWSFTNSISPLGPVGILPTWDEVAIGPDVSEFNYPDGEWKVPDENVEEETQLAALFEGDALDYLTRAIEEEEEGIEFEDAGDAVANTDETRLLEQDGDIYGGTVFEPTEALEEAEGEGAPEPVTVIMKYDPGNPLGKARAITGGTFLLFLIHLFGLARSERKVKQRPGAEVS